MDYTTLHYTRNGCFARSTLYIRYYLHFADGHHHRIIRYRWSTSCQQCCASPRPPSCASPGAPVCRVPFPSCGTPGRSSVPGGLACFAPAPPAGIPGRRALTSATPYACPACAAVTMPSVRPTTEAAPSTTKSPSRRPRPPPPPPSTHTHMHTTERLVYKLYNISILITIEIQNKFSKNKKRMEKKIT